MVNIVRHSPPWLTVWFYDIFPQKLNVPKLQMAQEQVRNEHVHLTVDISC